MKVGELLKSNKTGVIIKVVAVDPLGATFGVRSIKGNAQSQKIRWVTKATILRDYVLDNVQE